MKNKVLLTQDKTHNGGVDYGNRVIKIDIGGLHASIPSGYSLRKPPCQVGLNEVNSLDHVSVNIGDTPHYYGFGVLGTRGYMVGKLDQNKYTKPEELRIGLTGVIAEWLRLHKSNLGIVKGQTSFNLRLNLGFGMSYGLYTSQANQEKAAIAYEDAIATDNTTKQWVINYEGVNFRIIPSYKGLFCETVSIGETEAATTDWLVILDGGGGTLDVGIFKRSGRGYTLVQCQPSNKFGLVNEFNALQSEYMEDPERGLLSGAIPLEVLDPFYASLNNAVMSITRNIPNFDKTTKKLQLAGGITKLITPKSMSDFSENIQTVDKGVYANASAFRKKVSSL